MKNIRIHLLVLGVSAVLALGIALAQGEAPAPNAPPGGPEPAPGEGAPGRGAAGFAQRLGTRPVSGIGQAPLPSRRTLAPTPPLSHRPSAASGVPGVAPSSAASSAPAAANAESTAEAGDASGVAKTKTTTPALKFDNTPADIIVSAYCEQTGKTPLWAPDVPKANITLKSQQGVELTKEEYIEAIEVVLSMNGIVLEPFGEKFVKVLSRKTVRTDGIKIIMDAPENGHPEKTKVVSQMIQLKSIAVSEAQKALEGFKKPDGLFQTFERTNSILVTDTQENINRMLEIVKFIDQPLLVTEEVNVRAIRYAKADDVKKRIEELVAESQKQQQAKDEIKANASGAPGITRTSGTASSSLSTRPLPPGLTRLGAAATQPAAVTPNVNIETLISDADRGMIRGKVQIIADERTNKLIIITRPENMKFFDKIIEVLDILTSPDVQVKIIRLQHANVEGKDGEKGVADILNELIGNASASKSSSAKGTSSSKSKSSARGEQSGNQNLTGNTPTPAPTPAPAVTSSAAAAGGAKNKVGELSKENITILAEPRINGVIVMASPADMAVIESIISDLDVELEQVLIETVLLQVTLTGSVKTGIDWVEQVVKHRNAISYIGAGGGGDYDAASLKLSTVAAKTAGVKYWLTLDKLGMNAIVAASQEDSLAKVLQSPVLMTVNNREAVMESTEMRYLYKGVRYSGSPYSGTEVPDYEQRDFGMTIKVTPRISPNGNVMLTVDEKFENLGTEQFIPGAGGSTETNGSGGTGGYFPTINTRKLQADVSVSNGTTIVLGGLVSTQKNKSDSGIPVLKDIPYIGRYLFGKTEDKEERTELLVFLTPYVLKGNEEAKEEARRRKAAFSTTRVWQDGGWSTSKLADPPSKQDVFRKEAQKWKDEDAERDAEETRDKAKRARNAQMDKRALLDAKRNAKEDDQAPRQEESPQPSPNDGRAKEPALDMEPLLEQTPGPASGQEAAQGGNP